MIQRSHEEQRGVRHPIRSGSCPAPASPLTYARRRPDETTLYKVVQDNLATLYGAVAARVGNADGVGMYSTCQASPSLQSRHQHPAE